MPFEPNGDRDVAERVRALLETGEAAWCPMIRVELWNGVRGIHFTRPETSRYHPPKYSAAKCASDSAHGNSIRASIDSSMQWMPSRPGSASG